MPELVVPESIVSAASERRHVTRISKAAGPAVEQFPDELQPDLPERIRGGGTLPITEELIQAATTDWRHKIGTLCVGIERARHNGPSVRWGHAGSWAVRISGEQQRGTGPAVLQEGRVILNLVGKEFVSLWAVPEGSLGAEAVEQPPASSYEEAVDTVLTLRHNDQVEVARPLEVVTLDPGQILVINGANAALPDHEGESWNLAVATGGLARRLAVDGWLRAPRS